MKIEILAYKKQNYFRTQKKRGQRDEKKVNNISNNKKVQLYICSSLTNVKIIQCFQKH